jgi:hypothetical protein
MLFSRASTWASVKKRAWRSLRLVIQVTPELFHAHRHGRRRAGHRRGRTLGHGNDTMHFLMGEDRPVEIHDQRFCVTPTQDHIDTDSGAVGRGGLIEPERHTLGMHARAKLARPNADPISFGHREPRMDRLTTAFWFVVIILVTAFAIAWTAQTLASRPAPGSIPAAHPHFAQLE